MHLSISDKYLQCHKKIYKQNDLVTFDRLNYAINIKV